MVEDRRQKKSEGVGGGKVAIASYRDLEVFQRALAALIEIHRMVLTFPDYERYGLVDQMRRASKSVPANIAEGYGRRKTVRDFRRFLDIALGSANEMVVHLEIAQALGYHPGVDCLRLMNDYTIIAKMLYRLSENWQDFSKTQDREEGK